jgi:hypothetical protein
VSNVWGVTSARPDAARAGDRLVRLLWTAGTFLLVVMLVHIAALAIIGGPVTGPVSLRKPATFAETGWLLTWSGGLILPLLRTRLWQRYVIAGTAILFGVGETTIMAIQAWRGVPSHYNVSTPFGAALVRGGAAGTAGVFLVGVIVMLVAAIRSPDLTRAVRSGVIAGVVLLLVGCAIGFVMISNNSGVFQGTFGSGFGNRAAAYLGPSAATVGKEYLLLRPYTAGGDLVLLHAIGVHGLTLLAVPTILLARTSVPNQLRVTLVMLGCVGATMTILFVHAMRQLPLSALHPAAVVLIGLCVAVLVGSYVRIGVALLVRRAVTPVPSGFRP